MFDRINQLIKPIIHWNDLYVSTIALITAILAIVVLFWTPIPILFTFDILFLLLLLAGGLRFRLSAGWNPIYNYTQSEAAVSQLGPILSWSSPSAAFGAVAAAVAALPLTLASPAALALTLIAGVFVAVPILEQTKGTAFHTTLTAGPRAAAEYIYNAATRIAARGRTEIPM